MSNPIDDFTPQEYVQAVDEWLECQPGVTFHPAPYPLPKPARSVSVPLQMEIDDPALYDQICARRASWLQSLAATLGHLLYAYWQRGRRR